MGSEEMRVVVFTCDAYSWLIPTFLHFYGKNWPDNPYQTDFVTETKAIRNVPTFFTGKIPWPNGVIKYLKSIKEKIFLLLLEDYVIKEKVDNDRMKQAENLCAGDIGCVRLNPHDRLRRFLIDIEIDGFKEYPLDKPYSVSLQPAIWQKEFLLEFLQEGEDIRQVESESSIRIQKSKKKVIWADTPIITMPRAGGYMKKGRIHKAVEQWVKENW